MNKVAFQSIRNEHSRPRPLRREASQLATKNERRRGAEHSNAANKKINQEQNELLKSEEPGQPYTNASE
jgi:hypothetical protein